MKNQNHIQILPSVMCCKPWELKEYLACFERSGVDAIHFDVMDGHYVPNIVLGVTDFDAIRSLTALPMDVHLMCVDPEQFIPYFNLHSGDWVSFHPEACRQPYRLLQQLRARSIRAGYAISPAVPVSYIEEALGVLDFVLVMAVNPGFGGQQMVPDHLEKLRRIHEVAQRADHPIDLIVDGNTSIEKARKMYVAGATGFVTGTSSMLREGAAEFERLYTAYTAALGAQI